MNIFSIFQIPYVFLTQSYWRDEAFRILLSRYNLIDIVRYTYNDGQPPLYYYLLKLWIHFFGDSEIATRTLSVIFFEILIFVMYKFAQKIKPKSKTLPVTVSLLTFFNPSLIYYAFETRVYMMFILIVTLSFYFWYQRKYMLWALFSLLGLYSHNFMVFVLFTQALWFLLMIKDKKAVIGAGILILAGYLPWVGVLINQTRQIISDFWITPLKLGNLATSLGGLFSAYENDQLLLYPHFIILTVIILAICLISLKSNSGKELFWWVGGSVIPVVVVSVAVRPVYTVRYLCYLVIPLILIIALYIDGHRNFKTKAGLVTVWVMLSLYFLLLLYPYRFKSDIKTTVMRVSGMMHKEDLVYTTSLNFFETKYYFEKYNKSGYTRETPVKLFSSSGIVPHFVGKVLIKDEDIVSKIPTDKRIFAIDNQSRVTIYSRFR